MARSRKLIVTPVRFFKLKEKKERRGAERNGNKIRPSHPKIGTRKAGDRLARACVPTRWAAVHFISLATSGPACAAKRTAEPPWRTAGSLIGSAVAATPLSFGLLFLLART